MRLTMGVHEIVMPGTERRRGGGSFKLCKFYIEQPVNKITLID